MTTHLDQKERESEATLLKFFLEINFSAREKEIRKILKHSEIRKYALSSLQEIKLLHRKILEKLEPYYSGNSQYKSSILKDLDVILNNFLEKSKFPRIPDIAELEALEALFFPIKNLCSQLKDQLENIQEKGLKEESYKYEALGKLLKEEQEAFNKEIIFKNFLIRMKKEIGDRNPQPRGVYFVYAWPMNDNEKKEDWVQNFLVLLKEHLELAGLTTIRLDIVSSRYGGNIYEYMQKIEQDDYVLVFGTKLLKEQHEKGIAAVCTEIIHILHKREKDKGIAKVFPILLNGSSRTAFPVEYERYLTIKDWREKGYLLSFQELYLELFNLAPEQYLSEINKIWKKELSQLSEKDGSHIKEVLGKYAIKRKKITLGASKVFCIQKERIIENSAKKDSKSFWSKKALILLVVVIAAITLLCAVLLFSKLPIPTEVFVKEAHPDFTGRKEYLENLEKVFIKGRTQTLPVAVLYGEGGVGKSEIAIAFANTHLKDFSFVYWIESDIEEAYDQGYRDLARVLKIPFDEKELPKEIRKKVHYYLEHERFVRPWLLIFDNAERVLDLPKRGNGRVIITSRTQALWHSFKNIHIIPFSEKEALDLFQKIIHREEIAERKLLVKELDYFPLVLNQVAHYIAETPGMNEKEYLELLRQSKITVLKQMPSEPRYPYNLAASWQITADYLCTNHREVFDWLHFCSYLYPDSIPQSWIEEWLGEYKPELDSDQLQRKLRANNILRTLLDYSLVRYDEKEKNISLHRLRQEILQKDKRAESFNSKGNVLVFLAKKIAGLEEIEDMEWQVKTWSELYRWEPHAIWFLSHFVGSIEKSEVATLYNGVGNWRFIWGDYKKAEEFSKQALKIKLKLYGGTHPSVANAVHNLAWLLEQLGRYEEAKELYEQNLNTNRELFGKDSLEVASSMRCLGVILGRQQGRYDEAKKLIEQSLEINKRFLGEGNTELALCICDLAWILQRQGKYEEAKKLIEEVLKMKEKKYGEESPFIARCLDSLGRILTEQGKDKEGKKLIEKALEMKKKFFGKEHPYVAFSTHNLAEILIVQKKYKRAKKLLEEALEMNKKFYGEEHPQIARCMHSLGKLLGKQGKYKEAIRSIEKGIEMHEKFTGQKQPYEARAINDLGMVYFSSGDLKRAKELLEDALKIYIETVGISHPFAIETQNNLKQVAQRQKVR